MSLKYNSYAKENFVNYYTSGSKSSYDPQIICPWTIRCSYRKKKGVFILKDFIDHHCKDGVATHTIGEQYYKLHPIKGKSTAPSKIPSRK